MNMLYLHHCFAPLSATAWYLFILSIKKSTNDFKYCENHVWQNPKPTKSHTQKEKASCLIRHLQPLPISIGLTLADRQFSNQPHLTFDHPSNDDFTRTLVRFIQISASDLIPNSTCTHVRISNICKVQISIFLIKHSLGPCFAFFPQRGIINIELTLSPNEEVHLDIFNRCIGAHQERHTRA